MEQYHPKGPTEFSLLQKTFFEAGFDGNQSMLLASMIGSVLVSYEKLDSPDPIRRLQHIGSEDLSKRLILYYPNISFVATKNNLLDMGYEQSELKRFSTGFARVCEELRESYSDDSFNDRFSKLLFFCQTRPELMVVNSRSILLEIYRQTYQGVCEIKRRVFINK